MAHVEWPVWSGRRGCPRSRLAIQLGPTQGHQVGATSLGRASVDGLGELSTDQSASGFASAELRDLQLRFRVEGSTATTQWLQSGSAPACPQDNPDLELLCDLENNPPADETRGTVRVSLDGGTRNPWVSYGFSRTQTTTNVESWSFTEARLRIKTSAALSWNLGINDSDQTEIWQQNLSARWVVDPRASVSLGLTNNSDLGVGLQAGYEWRGCEFWWGSEGWPMARPISPNDYDFAYKLPLQDWRAWVEKGPSRSHRYCPETPSIPASFRAGPAQSAGRRRG